MGDNRTEKSKWRHYLPLKEGGQTCPLIAEKLRNLQISVVPKEPNINKENARKRVRQMRVGYYEFRAGQHHRNLCKNGVLFCPGRKSGFLINL